jgi:hypothetical protein
MSCPVAPGVTSELEPVLADRMVELCADAGEQARVVPMNLAIVDDRWALVAARASVAGHNRVAALVVHDSPLLTGLAGIFEVFWKIAVPITSDPGAAPTPETRLSQCRPHRRVDRPGAGSQRAHGRAAFREGSPEDRRSGRQIVGHVCTGAFDCWSDR